VFSKIENHRNVDHTDNNGEFTDQHEGTENLLTQQKRIKRNDGTMSGSSARTSEQLHMPVPAVSGHSISNDHLDLDSQEVIQIDTMTKRSSQAPNGNASKGRQNNKKESKPTLTLPNHV